MDFELTGADHHFVVWPLLKKKIIRTLVKGVKKDFIQGDYNTGALQ